MSPQFQSTIVLSLANCASSKRPSARRKSSGKSPRLPLSAQAPSSRRPPTLHIKLPGPLPVPLGLTPAHSERLSQRRVFELENLLLSLGEARMRETSKRALVQFVLGESSALDGLREHIWIAEQLCDPELIEILAEVASRCFDEHSTVPLGMAAVDVLARQTCHYSNSWLEWLVASTPNAEITERLCHRIMQARLK
jgi:hypothetical protein